MGGIRKQYDEEFKKNAVKLSHASPRPVREIAEDLGIHENVLYNWRRKYTAEGDKTKYATLEEENRDLQRQPIHIKCSQRSFVSEWDEAEFFARRDAGGQCMV